MQNEVASWRRTVAAISGILLGIIFLVSGIWKVLDPYRAGEVLEQSRVAAGYGVLGAASLGTVELLAAFLLFHPRFRRWGGLLGSALMLFFIAWVGYYYHALKGIDCGCFPIIKRAVGPNFFVGDGIFLLLGIAAYLWSPRVMNFRVPVAAFAALALVAGLSFGANAMERSHAQVPTPVIVDGKPVNLAEGKVFIFFYDPSCMHCDAAAKFMSKLNWGDTKIVTIPTINPQWAASFLRDTKLKGSTSLELDKMKKAFPFVDPPYGVALEDGRVKGSYGQAQFVPPLPQSDLQKLGFLH